MSVTSLLPWIAVQELFGLNGEYRVREWARRGNRWSFFYFKLDEEAFASHPFKSGPLETSFLLMLKRKEPFFPYPKPF